MGAYSWKTMGLIWNGREILGKETRGEMKGRGFEKGLKMRGGSLGTYLGMSESQRGPSMGRTKTANEWVFGAGCDLC